MFDKESAVKAMAAVCDQMEVEWERDGVMAIARDWAEHKMPLINAMRNHPDWNEEACAIIVHADAPKTPEASVNAECLEWFAQFLYEKLGRWMQFPNLSIDNKLTEQDVEILNSHDRWYPEDHAIFFGDGKTSDIPAVGMKKSRYVRKCLLRAGVDVDNDERAKKKFGEYADNIAIDGSYNLPIIISANPADFLSMSYGTTWASCHIINPDVANTRDNDSYNGCYKAGSLSYPADESTLIVYTVHDEDFNDLSRLGTRRKVWRQLFHINQPEKIIMQVRLYPFGPSDPRHDLIRSVVQGVFAQVWDVPNYWKNKKECWGFNTCYESLHYHDYEYGEMGRNVSYQPGHSDVINYYAIIGNPSYCLICGEKINDEESIYCYHHEDDDCRCAECGGHYSEDELYYCEDTHDYRCPDHSFYCDRCGCSYSTETEQYYIESTDSYYCEHCYEERCGTCSLCEQHYTNDDLHEGPDGEFYCDCCFDELFHVCNNCGQIFDITEELCPGTVVKLKQDGSGRFEWYYVANQNRYEKYRTLYENQGDGYAVVMHKRSGGKHYVILADHDGSIMDFLVSIHSIEWDELCHDCRENVKAREESDGNVA